MVRYKLVAAVAVCLAMLIDYTAYGCSCAPLGPVCEYVEQADVVLRGTVVSRPRRGEDPNDWVTYKVDSLTFYKYPTEPHVRAGYPQEISFKTAGNTAACGVELGIGEEYLIGLYSDDMGQLTANSCGLVSTWEGVAKEQKFRLEAGCPEDACGGTCKEKSQACIFHEGEHKCADVTCDPSPCADNEFCNLEKWDCTQKPCPVIAVCRDACNGECADDETCVLNKDVMCIQAPCPPIPECVKDTTTDPCDGRCGKFQECLAFEGELGPSLLGPDEQADSKAWYCADFCDPARCEDHEVCELLPTPCAGPPCPMEAVCRETCSGGCDKPQECVFYQEKGYKCAHQTCDPSPCTENETCMLLKSLPPVVICAKDNCNGDCDDPELCRQYEGNGKWYCSDSCGNVRCEKGEKCVTRKSRWCRESGFEGCPERRRCMA